MSLKTRIILFLCLSCAIALGQSSQTIRPSAIAGLFYPKDKQELSQTVRQFLEDAPPHGLKNIRALIIPHAGYTYSGKIAGIAYKQVEGRAFDHVILLAPSHYAAFRGVAVPEAKFFETPLGKIRVSPQAGQLRAPFQINPKATIQRPDWWLRSPLRSANPDQDTPHTWEHSLEIHLPFIQTLFPKAEILPLLFGKADSEETAEALEPLLNEKTLLIASSDLSHYHPYEKARELDNRCIQAVLDLNPESMEKQEACGKTPIQTLIRLAKEKGWKPKLLDYRNSGDTAGDKSRVVGYAAIAFYEATTASSAPPSQPSAEIQTTPPSSHSPSPSPAPSAPDSTETLQPADQPAPTAATSYSQEEREFLLKLARQTVETVVREKRMPKVEVSEVPVSLLKDQACFVTLNRDDRLRGCIGHLLPKEPLYRAVMNNARNAAMFDTRFPQVQPDELKKIEIEISILTQPENIAFQNPEELLSKLHPGEDGVILTIDGRQATFLPQVWEQIPEKEAFLNHLSRKAGYSGDGWQSGENVEVQTYRVESFEE